MSAQDGAKDAGEAGYMLLAANFERFRQQARTELDSQKGYGRVAAVRSLVPFAEAFEGMRDMLGPTSAQTLVALSNLAQTLASCPSLNRLDLSDNNLLRLAEKPSELATLANALGANKTLTDLNLNSNRLGPGGVRLVAQSPLRPSPSHAVSFSRR